MVDPNTLLGAAAAALVRQGLTVQEDNTGRAWTLRSAADSLTVEPIGRPRITPATVTLTARAASDPKPLLITRRLTRETLAACRDSGINCADAAGNMYLHFGATLIDIEGRRTTATPSGEERRTNPQLATPAGLQVTFLLLTHENAASWPMRRLAESSGTALGSVAATLKDLEADGFIERDRAKKRKLHRTSELFDRWTDGYSLVLTRRLALGAYRNETSRWWTKATNTVTTNGGQWGGETAAALQGLDLVAARGIVYAPTLPTKLLTTLRMRQAPEHEATLIVRRKFWTDPDLDRGPTVPAPLLYADLISAGDPRLTATAEELRRTDETLRRLDR